MKGYNKYLRVSKIPKDFPFSKSTLHMWASEGKFPGLFKKFGRNLFIDLEEFEKLFVDKTDRKSEE